MPTAPTARGPSRSRRARWWCRSAKHWYDFSVTANVDDGTSYLRRFAGRVENGSHGISDPAMGQAA